MTPDPSPWGDCDLVGPLPGGVRSDPFLVNRAGNVIRNGNGQLCLIDWDEARTGPQTLDTMHLARKTITQRRQHYATEALQGWAAEPEFARQLTKRILIKPLKMGL